MEASIIKSTIIVESTVVSRKKGHNDYVMSRWLGRAWGAELRDGIGCTRFSPKPQPPKTPKP